MRSEPFHADIVSIRKQARENIAKGAITAGYEADQQTVITMLNAALATELVCYLRYKRHFFMATGKDAQRVADEFSEHATQELQHADTLAARIVQIGGAPDFSPEGLIERSHAEYISGNTLQEMIQENLVAERIAIDSYRKMIQYLGDQDPTTRRILEEILAVEEEHADDMAGLLESNSFIPG